MSQVNRKQRNFQYGNIDFPWLKLLANMTSDISLRISSFSAPTNLKNYFATLTTGFVGVGHICVFMNLIIWGPCQLTLDSTTSSKKIYKI